MPDSPLSPDLLISKLNGLSKSPQYTQFVRSLETPEPQQSNNNYTFHLPPELQGGISSISTRRPSFAAEVAVSSVGIQPDFQSRRQSIQYYENHQQNHYHTPHHFQSNPQSQQHVQQHQEQLLELENGLLLSSGVIISSPQLQQAYHRTANYFCSDSAEQLYQDILACCMDPFIQKVILHLKKLNNMFSLAKPLALVLTKSGKFEMLSMPVHSNIVLQKRDVVIVDGDRGKDLVSVLAPSISLDCAILINYLKKRQHTKSVSYGQHVHGISNTVNDLVRGHGILDEETQFQVPTKQVLRFATPQEVQNVQFKLLEEVKSLKTALLKISNQPILDEHLTILCSEYQFDQKKLTFFYTSHQRLDFRALIKELFKIYKTRIWLCAVPPVGQVQRELNSDVVLEQCLADDFHVRNLKETLMELHRE